MNRLLVIILAVASLVGSSPLDWRIVGGKDAEVGQFPHMVSIRYTGEHNCGGSIINKNTVLTAAHCVEGYAPKLLTVVAGSNTLNEGGDTYNVTSTKYHPSWNTISLMNDIGIVKIAGEFVLSDLVQPVKLEPSVICEGEDLVLSGWGRVALGGKVPNNLQYIHLKSISVAECRQRQSPNFVYRSQICTFTHEGEGACYGDSGGPLVKNGAQVGIVSWGRPCASGYPDVFTRISSYRTWIETEAEN